MYIQRTLTAQAKSLFTQYPVVTITGPRQSGKTTLARQAFPDLPYYNLEDIETRTFAIEDPKGFLNTCPDGAILDEIQNVPDLTSYIQVRVDDLGKEGLYVLTGSRQFELMESISQSLAGRTALLKLLPFSFEEIGSRYPGLSNDDYMYRGFYPRIYDKNLVPSQALADYYTTYVERDLHQIKSIHNLSLFNRFIRLCAGRVGQLLNLSSLASDTGISHTTAHDWLSILKASYIVFTLEPFFVNIGKRLVKSPKLYFYDTGLASNLLGIEEPAHVAYHPLRGNLFENMAVMEILKFRFNRGRSNNLFFFRDSKGNEIDLMYSIANKIIPIEIKSAETITKEFFKGFKYFDENISTDAPIKCIIYGGDREEVRSGVNISSVKRIWTLLDKV